MTPPRQAEEGSKFQGIKNPKSFEDSRTQGLLLARTEETPAGVEVEPKPVEVQAPALAIKEEVSDVPATTRTPPDRSGKNQIELPELFGNLLLVLEEKLGILLAAVGVKLRAGPAHQLLSAD